MTKCYVYVYQHRNSDIFHIALLTREEVGIVLEKKSTLDTLMSVQFTADKNLDTVVCGLIICSGVVLSLQVLSELGTKLC